MANPVETIKDYISRLKLNTPKDFIFDNDKLIDFLHVKYSIPLITPDSEIKATGFDQILHYYKEGYFLFENEIGETCLALRNILLIYEDFIARLYYSKIYFVKADDFEQILQKQFADQNTYKAINYLTEHTIYFSAKTLDYLKITVGFAIIFFSSIIFFINSFNLINNIFYFLQNILKAVLFSKGMYKVSDEKTLRISEDPPIYSILIPLYKEEFKAKSIINAMKNLNYPKDKLDVKIIVEADDMLTQRALYVLDIPKFIQIIKVPYSLPRTKPKALNYAMSFVLGKYLAVYDAEDVPDPDQLHKAINAFDELSEQYVCVQAKLNFYNADENILTRLFSIEYTVWFEYLLKGLSLLDLPVTLGGTSNHFKVDKLREVGFWDAYNVTEDADLGIRLYLKGYKVHMIDSTTLEEAPTESIGWLYQRSRWIKGFFQTIFIFMKTKKDYKKFSLIKVFAVYIFVGLSTYSFLFLPWLLLILFFKLNPIIYYLWFVNSFFSISYMYTIAYVALSSKESSEVKLTHTIDYVTLIIWPLYFIMHSIASYRAVWDMLKTPFKWNKTSHGGEI